MEHSSVGRLLVMSIERQAALYEMIRGQTARTIHCHAATLRVLKDELLPDMPNIQENYDIVRYRGLRVVVDMNLNPGVIYVDGD